MANTWQNRGALYGAQCRVSTNVWSHQSQPDSQNGWKSSLHPNRLIFTVDEITDTSHWCIMAPSRTENFVMFCTTFSVLSMHDSSDRFHFNRTSLKKTMKSFRMTFNCYRVQFLGQKTYWSKFWRGTRWTEQSIFVSYSMFSSGFSRIFKLIKG